MSDYLELTTDEMVERLSRIQKLSRVMIKYGREPGVRYDKAKYEVACTALLRDVTDLANSGDVV